LTISSSKITKGVFPAANGFTILALLNDRFWINEPVSVK
jgi:hypothetical protein